MELTSITVQPCQDGFTVRLFNGYRAACGVLTNAQLDSLYEDGLVQTGSLELRFCGDDMIARAPGLTGYLTSAEWWHILVAAERCRGAAEYD